MKKINKILIVLIIVFLMISMYGQVFATIDPDDYGKTELTVDDASELTSKVSIILGVVRNISAIVSVITLMIIGIKYIMGSVEEKANYKATMMPYIIGCIMATGGATLVSFIYNAVH